MVLVIISLALLGLGAIETPIAESEGQGLAKPYGVRLHKSAARSFRIANFNIQRGKGTDDVRDISRATEALQGADIIALEEVAGTKFYGWNNQAQQIAKKLQLGYLFAPTMTKWFQPYAGNALLSKFEVSNWTVSNLPHGEGASGGYRNLIEAEVQIDGRPATLLITHLDRDALNEPQLTYVLERFRRVQGPVILFGDLNTDESNPQLVALLEDPQVTDAIHMAVGPFWRLDWIITRGFEVLDGGYTPRGISDHAHYWVEVSLL